ncbi:putative damage-inducible protein DinB [Marmoricola sp. URHA0025 HA25]
MNHEEPPPETADPAELFAGYLRYYREAAIAKVSALPVSEQRSSRLPTGWTPLELLQHLAYMERRWFRWNFLGEQVEEPWGDRRDDTWYAADDLQAEDVAGLLREGGAVTDEILASHRLDETSQPPADYPGPTAPLSWICFHVLQEYARHVGHLDIAVELAGGPTGE